jgi:FixJ family two-component response regulator
MLTHPVTAESGRLAIVDDDASVLRSLGRLLSLHGYTVETFLSASEFLESLVEGEPELLLLDLDMPSLDGLALQATLAGRGVRIPIVFLSGRGEVATSVRALQAGALDFLEKPVNEGTLIAALNRAAETAHRLRDRRALMEDLEQRARTLTPREREVFRWVVSGRLNKQTAAILGTREKTIKVHRARVMSKMRAESVADLVRIYDLLDSWSWINQSSDGAAEGGADEVGDGGDDGVG